MTWEEQLQNCVTNDTSASGRILHLTPYMDELIKSTHSMALQKQFIPPTAECNFQFADDYL